MHLLRSFLLLFIILLGSFSLLAQDRCGVEVHRKYLEKKDPTLKIRTAAATARIRQEQAALRTAGENFKIYRIPVVVHVIWNTPASNISDSVIRSQINVLNRDYRRLNADTAKTFSIFKGVAGDAGFEFFLAAIDPDGNPTTGIVRNYTSTSEFYPDRVDVDVKPLSVWPREQYLNLWITTLKSGYIGVGPIPDFVYAGTDTASQDGIVIDFRAFGLNNYNYNLGRTATHEIGHWLGLIHIWGSGLDTCGTDQVDDTPVQKTDNELLGNSCPAHYSYCTGTKSQDMADNYMDYSPDQCMNIFTQGQISRMRFVMENNPSRIALQSSPAQNTIAGLRNNEIRSLSLYPNPSKDFIAIVDHSSRVQTLTVWVINAIGETVLTTTGYTPKDNSPIDVSVLKPGIYFIKISTDETSGFLTRFTKL